MKFDPEDAILLLDRLNFNTESAKKYLDSRKAAEAMISETILILTILAAVFITGASLGQLLLRIRLAKLERMNLEMEQKRIVDLKKAINSRAIIIERRRPTKFEQEVQDEIDEILGDIENLSERLRTAPSRPSVPSELIIPAPRAWFFYFSIPVGCAFLR